MQLRSFNRQNASRAAASHRPRRYRWALKAGTLSTLALLISLAFALGGTARQVYAASTITVTTTADENGAGAACSLREALTSANTNSNFGGCTGAAGGPF